jgi:hypothetical protein
VCRAARIAALDWSPTSTQPSSAPHAGIYATEVRIESLGWIDRKEVRKEASDVSGRRRRSSDHMGREIRRTFKLDLGDPGAGVEDVDVGVLAALGAVFIR